MPVSTRSQIAVQDQNGTNPETGARPTTDQEENHSGNHLRNPHHRLKEKMRALTLQYEQHKQASTAHRGTQSCLKPEDCRFSTHPSIDLLGSNKRGEIKEPSRTGNVMRENNAMPNSTMRSTFVLPPNPNDAKENLALPASQPTGPDRIVGFSCPRKVVAPMAKPATTAARRLSLMNAVPPEGRGGGATENVQESEIGSEKVGIGSRILVFVRLRPMCKKEREAGSRCCVRIVNKRDVYLTEFATENDYLRLKRLRGRHFTFDASFPDSTTQLEVYSTTTANLVEAVLEGRNGTVFCYGATGAGKTYTMLGTVENPGVMVLAIKDLFSKIRQRSYDGNHVVQLSYLEVYNETVRDLLSPGRPLVLREDKQGITAAGLTQYRAYSTDEVMALLQQGNLHRTTEPTRVNETSSRSHAILQVMVEYRVKDASMNIVNRVGKLSLIDLAGSERAIATDQRTLRSVEGANINRSLLALSSCINALVEGKKHIPYRNSKLTQLLKDSLGGSCNTVMIANISPSSGSFGETQNTLHWADRAKEIKTKNPMANEEILQIPESEADQAKLLLELQKENRELRVQLARLQQKLLSVQAQSMAANASPTPSTATSLLTPPSSAKPNEKRKPRSSFLGGNCFTPESIRRGAAEETVKELRQTIKTLERDMDRMKKDHALQLKQRDDLIRKVPQKAAKPSHGVGGEGVKRIVTRASLRPKDPDTGELRSPCHRFHSPAPTAKKRSYWDIAATSPSTVFSNGRKTRSHVIPEPAQAPSMLLQPGFARQRPEPWRQ